MMSTYTGGVHTYIKQMKQKCRQAKPVLTDRQTETDRQKDRQTNRQTDKDGQKDRQQKDKHTNTIRQRHITINM